MLKKIVTRTIDHRRNAKLRNVAFLSYSTTTAQQQASGLYIIGTPIGNLRDMTLRGIDVLQRSHIIACEDTRQTIKLLNHYKITTSNKQLLSYTEGKDLNQIQLYQHSQNTLRKIISAIAESGQVVSLCSDAGMPCVSDPGMLLIHKCYENNIPVYCIPGPSAVTSAVALSGFPTSKFLFEGFLPTKKNKRIETLQHVKTNCSTYSFVFFEAPTRIVETMNDCIEVFGENHWCCICSEITKKFERVNRGTLAQVKHTLMNSTSNSDEIRGEFTIVIAPKTTA
jgi:16S rRNA (cytidine1402-2'-O)-methyltransferase